MTGKLQRRFRVLIAAASTAILCWIFIPGSALDRAAFTGVSLGFANPPLFVSGQGSHQRPWQIRTLTPGDRPKNPPIFALADDLQGFFQSSPPSPVDMAVIFSNMRRIGGAKAASGVVLGWDAPDPIGLMALDKALARFDSLVMAAPLSRGVVPEPMPAAFRNASIPLEKVHGNPATLPIVNRVPLPGLILGKENTLAAFQSLDSEPDTGFIPLLARWEDQIVFAFPLLAALQRLDLPLDGVEVRIGESIQLGPEGPIVPIDRFGRMTRRIEPRPLRGMIPAEDLIDGGPELLPEDATGPMILVDRRSNAEPATRGFTGRLPTAVATIEAGPVLAPAHACPRPGASSELAWLGLLVVLLTTACTLPGFPRQIAFLLIAAACMTAQYMAVGIWETWLPGVPALAAILAAFPASLDWKKRTDAGASLKNAPPQAERAPQEETHPAPTPDPAPSPAAAEPKPKSRTAKKTAAKTAKKAPGKSARTPPAKKKAPRRSDGKSP